MIRRRIQEQARPSKINKVELKQLEHSFHEAFPQVFGNHERQGCNLAQYTTKMIIKNLKDTTLNLYYQKYGQAIKKIKKDLIQFLEKKGQINYQQKYEYLLQSEYGCTIVLQRSSSISNIFVYIVFPTAWQTSLEFNLEVIKQYPGNPQQFQHILLGQIQSSQIPLMSAMKQIIKYARAIIENNEKNLKAKCNSAAYLIDVVQKAISLIKIQNGVSIGAVQYDMKVRSNQKILPKGGIYDVGISAGRTKPDTILPVLLALLQFFTKNKQFVQAYQMEYKIYLLNCFVERLDDKKYMQEKQLNQQNKQEQKQKQKYKSYQLQKSRIQKVMRCSQLITAELGQFQNKYIKKSKVRQILQKTVDTIKNYCQKRFNIKPLSFNTEDIIKSQEDKATNKNKSNFPQVIAYDRLIIKQQNLQKINYFKGVQLKKSQQFFSYLIAEITNLLSGDGNYKKITDKMRQLQIVQDVFLTIALNHIPNRLDFREFKVQIDSLWKLANAYQSATLEMKKASNQNQSAKSRTNNQIMSYFWLIKTIIAIIGFQITAQNIPQLKGFKVPIDFDKIYDNFTASSAKAHAAARCIKSYFKQRQKDKKFFLLSNQVSEETQTFIKIYFDNNGLQQIYNKKLGQLQKEIIQLSQTVKIFKQKYKEYSSRIIQYKQYIEGNVCECGEVIQHKWLGGYINLQTRKKQRYPRPGFVKDIRQQVKKITCYYHIEIQKLESKIAKMYHQREEQKIKVDFSQKNYQQIIFFQQLNAQLGYLIDLILFCQISERTTNQKYKLKDFNQQHDNQIQLKQQGKFHFASRISKYKGLTKFDMLEVPTYLVSQQVMYLNSKIGLSIFRVSNQFEDFHKLSQIGDRQFCNQHSSWRGLKFVIDPPLVMSNPQQLPCQRQHKIYQKLSNLPKNITQSQFILFASLRCTTDTELILVLNQILKRNLIILPNDEHKEIKSKIIHSIFRRLKSNQDLQCEQFDKRTYWTIYNFLQSYGDSLTQNDFRFFPILGPLIAFMCARINNVQKKVWNYAFYPTKQPLKHKKLLTTILKQALSHYSKLQQQIQKKNLQITQGKAKQKLILFEALCCFTQQLLTFNKQDSLVTELFIKVYLLYGHITIQQTQGFQSYLKIMIDNHHIVSRTTFCNISKMVEYCQKHVDRFVSIIDFCYHIKIMQPNIKKQGLYLLQIQCKNVKNKIKIDFCNGFSTINSRQILKLSENASKLVEYKQLFGTVQYQTTYTGQLVNSLKINKNFKLIQMDLINQGQKEILQPINSKVQFELKKPKIKQLPIYMILMRIIQNQNKNEYMRLPIPRLTSSTGIPEYYLYKYRPWLNQKEKYIVFKQPFVEQIHKTALIMKINQNSTIKLFVIPKHHSILSVSTLLKNINKYQQLQPHFESVYTQKKQQKLQLKQPKDILLKIQKSQFIHVLINQDKKIGKRYWLHRYDLNFIMHNDIGLIPTIFSGYKVSHTPFTHQYVPWTEQDNIPCIVLQKFQQNQFTLQSHKIKLVIPNLEYVDNKFKIPFEVDQKISIYTYDIHDHFHDIRGSSRESQIYLALLLIHTNKGFRQKQINITPIEQAMQVLKTCFNNRPLNSVQLSKITSIIKISIHKNYYSILLICEALLIATRQLVGIYKQISTNHIDDKRNQSYFQSVIQYWQQNNQQKLSKIYNEVLPRAKYIYEQLNKIKAIPMRLNIPQEYTSLLGIRKQSASNLTQQQQEQFMINERKIGQMQRKIKKALKDVEIMKDKIIKSRRAEQIQINKFEFNLKGSKLLGNQIEIQFMKSTQCFKKQIAIQKQIQKIQFKNYLPEIKECMENLEHICSYIQQFINKTHIHHNAPRRLQRKVGLDPLLVVGDFTKVVVDSYINDLYPIAQSKQKELIINLVKGWLKLKVQSDSLKRLKIRIKDTNIDVIQIMRQCQSPRQQVYKRPYWLCFQVQMKLQIWLSQFQTYNCLFNENQDNMKQKGRFSQLNMGQGKTQTIIPMIVLQKIFQDKKQQKKQKQKSEKRTPRINCLSSLYSQVFSNFFKFLSVTGFKIPILELPFERSIKFTNQTIKSIRRSFLQFSHRALALINQSSSHSMILKQRQKFIISNISNQQLSHKDHVIFQGIKFFDVFDQIDALMSPKKEFVYSLQLNNKNQFQFLQLRTKICKLLLQEVWSLQQKLINQKIGVLDNVQSDQNQMSRIRLIINSGDDRQKIQNFRSQIYDKVIRKITQTSFIFRQENNQREQDQIKQYVIKSNSKMNPNWKLPEITLNALYILRGSLGVGVLQHCLSLRYRIQYGVPDKERILTTRLAVPYEAAQVPSKKNQFSHPQVTIYLTYLAYYYEGLSYDGFFNVLTFISKLKHIQRLQIYQQWLKYSKNNQIKMKNLIDLNLQNISEIKKLYKVMYKNKRIVELWLQHFVLQKQLIHFPHVITSSSWDLSCVQKSVGFSGTKDCSILFPTYIQYQPSQNIIIRATDAKMINLVIDNTNNLIQLENSQDPLWIKLIDKCMQEKVSCLIDVGAYLAGKSIQKQVIPYIIKHNLFNVDKKLKGIAFYSLNKKNWSVYNLSNKQIISLRTLIQDHQTFVIFDQYRTRGADLRMDKNIKAILTLSSNLPKDDFMQAVGRLRKLGRNQKLTLVMTTEVRQKIQKTFDKKINNLRFKQQIQLILNWSSSNSLREIQQYLYCHSNHAKIHLENQINSPNPQQCKISPQYMYSKQLKSKTVKQQCLRMFQKIKNAQISKQEHKNMIDDIVKLFQKYGSQISIQVNNFDQQTEKQKEMNTQKITQKQPQAINELSIAPVRAILEDNQFKFVTNRSIEWLKYFNFQYISFTRNFVRCTEVLKAITTVNNQKKQQIFTEHESQLQHCFFIFLKKKNDNVLMNIITQRQASTLFRKKQIILYVSRLDIENYYRIHLKNGILAMLDDLTINSPIIRQNNLQNSLVQMKLYNGIQDYTEPQCYFLHHLFYRSMEANNNLRLSQITQYFLKRRHLKEKIYPGSRLQSYFQKFEDNLQQFKNLPNLANLAIQ